MAKITQYPAKTVPSNNDEFVLHDPSSGSTKKMTRGDLLGGAPLPAGSIDAQSLADGSITAAKLSSTSGVSLPVGRKYTTGNTNTSGASIFQTITGGTITFTAETGQLYLITVTGGTVTNGTGTGTNVVLRLADGTTSLRDLSFSVPNGAKMPCPTIRHFTPNLTGSVTINLRGASATATNVQWDGIGGGFCLTVEKVLSA